MLLVELAYVPCCPANRQTSAKVRWKDGRHYSLDSLSYRRS
jgi:hypothetical protein